MINKLLRLYQLPLSRKLQFFHSILLRLKSRYYYKLIFKAFGNKSIIKKPLFITPECISLGRGVYIWDDARIEAITSYAGTNYTPHVIIEDGVSIQQRAHITAASTLIIGKNSLISFDVSIQDTDHEYENIDVPVAQQPLQVKPTVIGENCFIGSGAKIQAGTILGRHCIVGTNAVVKGVFPDYSVIVGVPAKIVKRYDIESKRWIKTNSQGEFLDAI